MTETRDFHIGDVLTITTGKLLSLRHMDGVYDILNWMTGDNLFTHQLPRAARECEAPLLAQHPQLAGVIVPAFKGTNRDEVLVELTAFLDEVGARFGMTLPVAPLDDDQHTEIDPLSEIKMMRPDLPIIAVEI